jgi:AraC-like DNA-binding protein
VVASARMVGPLSLDAWDAGMRDYTYPELYEARRLLTAEHMKLVDVSTHLGRSSSSLRRAYRRHLGKDPRSVWWAAVVRAIRHRLLRGGSVTQVALSLRLSRNTVKRGALLSGLVWSGAGPVWREG